MSFKHLFSRSLAAAPGRLHMAAHSHHLWPDASFDGHIQAWLDAAALADRKWDKVMGEVWPEAQHHVAAELGVRANMILFSANTHDFIIRLVAAARSQAGATLRVLTSDGEFHSARRQFARWEEEGQVAVTRIACEPHDSFADRFMQAASAGGHDLIMVSHVLFASGRVFTDCDALAACADPAGPWVVIDGYHAFMAVSDPLPPAAAPSAFYLGGGYKYAMAGEGMAFMYCPDGFGARPPVTGWYAEFGNLTAPPGSSVGYTKDAMRFMGATFDPSALYRFNAVRRALEGEGLTTSAISDHVARLQAQMIEQLAGSPLADAELLNPLHGAAHARFLAFRSPKAAAWNKYFQEKGCVTDVRGDVLRVGLGLYHDGDDVESFARLARSLD